MRRSGKLPNRVVHHGTGKSMTTTRYMKGYMDEIWS